MSVEKSKLKAMSAKEREELMKSLQEVQEVEEAGGAPYLFCTHPKSIADSKGAAVIAHAKAAQKLKLKFVAESKATNGYLSCFASESPITGMEPMTVILGGQEVSIFSLDSVHSEEISEALKKAMIQPFPRLSGGTLFTKEQMERIYEEGAMVLNNQTLVLERQASETAFNLKNTAPLLKQLLGNKMATAAFSKVQNWFRTEAEKKILDEMKEAIAKETDEKVREALQKDFDKKDQKETRAQIVETAFILGSAVYAFKEAREAVANFVSLGPELQEILKGHITPIKQQLNALLGQLAKMIVNLQNQQPVEFLARLSQLLNELDALLSAIAAAQKYLGTYIQKLDKYKETAERIRQEEKWMIGLDVAVIAWHAIVDRSIKIPDAARVICIGTRLYNIIEQGKLLKGVNYHSALAREYLQVLRCLYALLNDDNEAALKGRLTKMNANKGKLTAARVEWEVIKIEWVEPLENMHKAIAEQVGLLEALQSKKVGSAGGPASTATAAAGTSSKTK